MSREEKYLHLSSTSRLPCLLYLSPCCSLHLQYQLPNLMSTNFGVSKSMTEEACIVYKTGNHRTQWSKRWRWCVRKGICARLGRVCCWMLDRGRLEGRSCWDKRRKRKRGSVRYEANGVDFGTNDLHKYYIDYHMLLGEHMLVTLPTLSQQEPEVLGGFRSVFGKLIRLGWPRPRAGTSRQV